jgi:hypothetical protein
MGEIRDRWVAALRLGEYRQGTEYLRRERAGAVVWCCLGVLCDLYVQEFGQDALEMIHDIDLDNGPRTFTTFNGRSGSLPVPVAGWVGIARTQESDLAKMDDRGDSFDVIADAVENLRLG